MNQRWHKFFFFGVLTLLFKGKRYPSNLEFDRKVCKACPNQELLHTINNIFFFFFVKESIFICFEIKNLLYSMNIIFNFIIYFFDRQRDR